MSEIRVLHVIARMNVGGTATYIANLIRGLEALGVNSLLALGSVPKGEIEDSVVNDLRVERIACLSRGINIIKDVIAYWNLRKVINEFSPDLIHTHTFKAGFLLRVSTQKCPVIHSFHGHHLYDPEFNSTKRAVLIFLEKKLARRTMALISIGKKVGDELQAVGIGTSDNFYSIAPGIPTTQVIEVADKRAKFGITESQTVVMWLGRFIQVKRPDLVIEIARALPELTFVMAGNGDLFESCKSKAPKNLKLVGFQDKDEMWKMADIGLCTSESEGMPLSIIEAQMAGVPVVSTNVGSVSEIVVDRETGILANSLPDLIEGVKWVQKSLRESEEIVLKSRKNALENFTTEKVATSHLGLYKKVLDSITP